MFSSPYYDHRCLHYFMLTFTHHMCSTTYRAREKGVATYTERPRSWHASKHSSIDNELSTTSSSSSSSANTNKLQQHHHRAMRSPSGYPPLLMQQHQNNSKQQRRTSKGWVESGDLKSVYTVGSRDSLLSTGSNNSMNASRLSLASSGLSSERMSTSRNSLDNLCDVQHHQQGKHRNVTHPSLMKVSSGGIVTKNKSMFEQLSQKQTSRQTYRGSHDSLDKISQQQDTHAAVAPVRHASSSSSTSSRRHYSPTSPHADATGNNNIAPSSRSSSTTSTMEYKYCDAKIVKTSTLERRKHSRSAPEPPARDSSVETYKQLNKNRLSTGPQQLPLSPKVSLRCGSFRAYAVLRSAAAVVAPPIASPSVSAPAVACDRITFCLTFKHVHGDRVCKLSVVCTVADPWLLLSCVRARARTCMPPPFRAAILKLVESHNCFTGFVSSAVVPAPLLVTLLLGTSGNGSGESLPAPLMFSLQFFI